ncbi:metallophosphoesterase [Candidatus Woesearchaeota archaeon]|nr:metallophosphoesterase [Candidatus Woesearchaeota archaeon]
MKILAVGDIHGDSRLAKRMAEKAFEEKVDLVILCGDLTYAETKLDYILGPFVNRKLKVAFVPGNHESAATADFWAQKYGVINLHGASMKHMNVGFFGCGGANVGPVHMLQESEIFYRLSKAHEGVKDSGKRVMVTHVHPSGSMMERLSDFVSGSDGVRRAIDELGPDIVLCGHIHEARGIEELIGRSRVFNVATKEKIFEIS